MNVKQRTVAELMSRDVVSVGPLETLRSAAATMQKHHIHCLLITPEQPHGAVGIITGKDIVQVLCESEPALLDQLRVADVMSRPAISVQADFLVGDAIKLMRMSGVRSVPVLRGIELVGLLSYTDVLRAALED
ncbi:MAG TPA: CBS domain-containing protein [Polyangiales bacterium]